MEKDRGVETSMRGISPIGRLPHGPHWGSIPQIGNPTGDPLVPGLTLNGWTTPLSNSQKISIIFHSLGILWNQARLCWFCWTLTENFIQPHCLVGTQGPGLPEGSRGDARVSDSMKPQLREKRRKQCLRIYFCFRTGFLTEDWYVRVNVYLTSLQ